VTHLSQPPAIAAWTPCMRVGGAEGWSAAQQRVREAEGDGGRGKQSPRGMRVRQAKGVQADSGGGAGG
jgi:hypothetical protein